MNFNFYVHEKLVRKLSFFLITCWMFVWSLGVIDSAPIPESGDGKSTVRPAADVTVLA